MEKLAVIKMKEDVIKASSFIISVCYLILSAAFTRASSASMAFLAMK